MWERFLCKGSWNHVLQVESVRGDDNPVRGNHQAPSHSNTTVEINTYPTLALGRDRFGAKRLEVKYTLSKTFTGLPAEPTGHPASR